MTYECNNLLNDNGTPTAVPWTEAPRAPAIALTSRLTSTFVASCESRPSVKRAFQRPLPHISLAGTSTVTPSTGDPLLASVPLSLQSTAPATVPGPIPAESVWSRVPISSEQSIPSRYASTSTGQYSGQVESFSIKEFRFTSASSPAA